MKLLRRVTLRQLEVFAEAARHGSYSKVAAALHLTQPAVSMQIRQLEDAAGLPLFERVGRRQVLTDAGARLLDHASRVLGELSDAQQSLQSLQGLKGGAISVGLVSTAEYFTPKLLARFSALHEGIDVGFTVGNREMLVRLLRENRIDLAVMGRPPQEVDCIAEPLADNPHVLVAAVDHPLRRKRRLELESLAAETFLQREPGSGTRILIEELFAKARFKPRRLLTFGSNETIKQAVMAGLGLSLLSLHTLALELRAREIAILPVDGMPLMRTWHVVHARQRRLSPAASAFRSFLVAQTQPRLATAFAPWAAAASPAPAGARAKARPSAGSAGRRGRR
jgi:DNA-binding transcriptional LysR family regulator